MCDLRVYHQNAENGLSENNPSSKEAIDYWLEAAINCSYAAICCFFRSLVTSTYLAKNIVASGCADQCEVQLSYAIGLADPMALRIDTFGTEKVSLDKLVAYILTNVDLRPAAIIQRFGLTKPIFSAVSCYGHFGSNASNMPWEQTNLQFDL